MSTYLTFDGVTTLKNALLLNKKHPRFSFKQKIYYVQLVTIRSLLVYITALYDVNLCL